MKLIVQAIREADERAGGAGRDAIGRQASRRAVDRYSGMRPRCDNGTLTGLHRQANQAIRICLSVRDR
ncbi:hypothetical protein [Burkholderia sp. SIMBA_062]|uniref:hypothetical protein n=1 Tax=Burkholderia sp. SIMBA_062 TaxID=3085803 RepID=UPI00397A6DA1